MTDLTKLAEQLDAFNELSASLAISEAARILRSAAAVDVKALITIVQDFGSARWAEGFDEKNKPYGESALHKKVAVKKLAALESALRLALAARDDDVFTALDMSPDTFRTEGGAVNVGKLRAAIRHPADYLPPDHWLAAAAPKGTT